MAEVIIIETTAYYELLRDTISFIKKQMEKDAIDESELWIAQNEAQKILPYKSKVKWQELRSTGQIEFRKIGRKILYNKTSILNYIKKYRL